MHRAHTAPAFHRPTPVATAASILIFLGVSAMAGGAALLLGTPGAVAPPLDWLDPVPVIDTWLVPGLVLGLGFGVGSLVTAHGLVRRPRWPLLAGVEHRTGRHWSWLATLLIGAAMVGWIAVQLVYLPGGINGLQIAYGGIGIALVALASTSLRKPLGEPSIPLAGDLR